MKCSTFVGTRPKVQLGERFERGCSTMPIPRDRILRYSLPAFVLSASAVLAANADGSTIKRHTSNFSYNGSSVKKENLPTLSAFVKAFSSDVLKFRKRSCLCEANFEIDEETMKSQAGIDYSSFELLQNPPRFGEFHAIDGTLRAPNLIERYNVYKTKSSRGYLGESQDLVIADIKFGTKVNGHPKIVHGGIISLLFDDIMGFAYGAAIDDFDKVAFTAYIKVDFRAPLPENTNVLVHISLEKLEGRKIFLKGEMTSIDGSVLYSEAESLYILAKTE